MSIQSLRFQRKPFSSYLYITASSGIVRKQILFTSWRLNKYCHNIRPTEMKCTVKRMICKYSKFRLFVRPFRL